MQFVSFLGLLFLLGMTWLMSYHRTKIKLRPIIWGMGLQFLLAMVILKENEWSFVGMALLAVVLIVYLLKDEPFVSTGPALKHMVHLLVMGVFGVALYFLHQTFSIGWILFGLLAVLLVNWLKFKDSRLHEWGSAAFVTAAVTFLVASEMTGKVLFQMFSDSVKNFLSLSDYGANFLFGSLVANDSNLGFLFAFKVLPTIIFFGGFMSVMYYFGVVQVIIGAISRFMRWTMGTSGSETLSCSANIFVGQTEAPLLIKPFIKDMTNSELLTIMVGGFATIAGGVLAGYIGMGVDAGHLIAASVMSAPAALVISKIIYPELKHSATAGDVDMPKIETGENVLEAAASGISDGFKLALNVGAMLIGFIALIAVLDVILNWADYYIDGKLLGGQLVDYKITGNTSPIVREYAGFFPGSLQTLFGTLLRPLAWLMGVPWEDAGAVGNLLGVKLSLNEFVAFGNLGSYIQAEAIGPRARTIATYALCGFANFSSIGIQLGGISSLVPERRSDLAKVVLRAMFGGAFASWTTACVAGMMMAG